MTAPGIEIPEWWMKLIKSILREDKSVKQRAIDDFKTASDDSMGLGRRKLYKADTGSILNDYLSIDRFRHPV